MFSGGCSCGAIRYEAKGEPLFSVICYCRDCQQASGTGHVPIIGVAKDSFSVTGTTKGYTRAGGSGMPATRHFCPECGSLLFGIPEVAPTMVSIYVGSLDDLSVFQPKTAIFTRSRADWDKCAMPLKEFDTLPQRGG